MKIHLLVEGPAEKDFFDALLPRALIGHSFNINVHQGKGSLPTKLTAKADPKRRGLLDQLPSKLRAYQKSLNSSTDRVLILVDADSDDCVDLAIKIRSAATTLAPGVHVVVRIAIEEVEAFYLGDLAALEIAFPNANMTRARQYSPDSICATWEEFGAIVDDDGARKREWAQKMGAQMSVDASKNRSPSFRAFLRALKSLSMPPSNSSNKPKRKFHHVAKKK